VRICVSGHGLKRTDLLSKSDPYCEVLEKVENEWVRRGKTEVAKDNQSPQWETYFELDYFFEKTQPLKFRIFDSDVNSDVLLGEIETTVG
jgi:Ca2+-dependent lipid-binding protein